ncbi:MAG: hypothetical protein NVS2B7_34910 [Herpetosiphon sp.]
MELLETLTVHHGSEPRRIELYRGDLTDLKAEEAVDILVVSAFPGIHKPVPGTLIGALDGKGLSIEALAQDKDVDLCATCSCWLSKKLHNPPAGIQFNRILCFEPEEFMRATLFVGDIFRSLMALLPATMASTSVAMPLVSTGQMKLSVTEILEAILDAATHWLTLGLPVHTLKIVVFLPEQVTTARSTFVEWSNSHAVPTLMPTHNYSYDLFMSYSHENKDSVDFLVTYLMKQRPKLRIFLDRKALDPGMAWQQEIYEAIDNCRYVVAIYSPDYIRSKMCRNEFGIATYRQLNQGNQLLFPIFLFDAQLPSYMGAIHYDDCREGSEELLVEACHRILTRLQQPARLYPTKQAG